MSQSAVSLAERLPSTFATGAGLLMALDMIQWPSTLFDVQNLHATCGRPSRFLLHTLKLAIPELKSKRAIENEAEPNIAKTATSSRG